MVINNMNPETIAAVASWVQVLTVVVSVTLAYANLSKKIEIVRQIVLVGISKDISDVRSEHTRDMGLIKDEHARIRGEHARDIIALQEQQENICEQNDKDLSMIQLNHEKFERHVALQHEENEMNGSKYSRHRAENLGNAIILLVDEMGNTLDAEKRNRAIAMATKPPLKTIPHPR